MCCLLVAGCLCLVACWFLVGYVLIVLLCTVVLHVWFWIILRLVCYDVVAVVVVCFTVLAVVCCLILSLQCCVCCASGFGLLVCCVGFAVLVVLC